MSACLGISLLCGAILSFSGQVFGAASTSRTAAAPATGSPAAWLWDAGKSEDWKSATARCRDLLDRLDIQSDLARKHLPQVKEKVQLLLRTPSFDWKKQTAIDYLENLLGDLIAGAEPHRRYSGKEFGYPYWSDTMQRIEAIWIHVPPGYEPSKSYQLFMYYKCGGGIHFKDGKAAGGHRPTLEVANQTDTFHVWSSLDVQVKGRMGAHIELAEATAALCRDFSVDPDRIFLTGWSDGGFTAIWLASRYPHLVAGIAPNCGNWQYGNVENVGLSNVPTLAVDGWGDGGYNNLQFCRWLALRGMGADAACIWGQHGHSYQPYEDVQEFKYIVDWAKSRKRDLYPRKVRYATWNLHWNRAYWLAIERMASPAMAAQVEAEVKDGNRIDVQTWNVAAYRLTLSEQLVDPAKPVQVFTNGRQFYSGPYKAELSIELSPPPPGKYLKSASMPDEITTVMGESSYDTRGFLAIPARRWLFVTPTGWNAETAKLLAKWPPAGAKRDEQITDDDLNQNNLLIYGGPDINKLAGRIADELPVKVAQGRFTVGNRVFDQPANCVAFIHPNPLNPKKYIIVYAFNDPEAFARNRFFGLTGGSLSEFRSGDCVISGIPAEPRRWGVAVDNRPLRTLHLMFDAGWQADCSAPVGELQRPMDYPQILRLKADAIREATGADIGVIWEHTPSWNRWGTSLPAGPVTLHDLATIDMFPENIVLGDMKGSDLPRRDGPAAWTVVADPRDPAHDVAIHPAVTEIDRNRTYRVAMGYFGQPSYGAEPPKMPRLFPFTTPEQFLAGPGAHIPLKNARQLPLQVIEATAQYIQKRKSIAPRRACFDLAEYIINPHDNDYGANDWLHLGLDAPRGPAGGERYVLNLGLRESTDPDPAPPRSNGKAFLDLDDRADAGRFYFANLDRKLPVSVAIQRQSSLIRADEQYRTFALAESDVRANVVGRCTLFTVTIKNAGTKEIAASAVISCCQMRSIYGQFWPDEDRKSPPTFYAGYHNSVGQYQQPPSHEDAALLLYDGDAPRPQRIIAPRAGYNFGLAGLSFPLVIKPGQSAHLPVLLIAVDRPLQVSKLELAGVLDSLKPQLRRAAFADTNNRTEVRQ